MDFQEKTPNTPTLQALLLNKFISTLHEHWIVLLIVIFAIGIRSINLSGNQIFAYDQGRDFTRVYEMIHEGDIKLVGPETDLPGVFNGVLYYYLLTALSLFSRFNIDFIAFSFVVINSFVCFVLYKFALDHFSSKLIGVVSAFLWAISFEQSNFARYISNASLMIPTSILFFVGMAYTLFPTKNRQESEIKGVSYGYLSNLFVSIKRMVSGALMASFIGLGLSMHVNYYLIYLGLLYPLFYIIYKPKIRGRHLLLPFVFLFIIISPFILAEVRWSFMSTRTLSGFIFHQTLGEKGLRLSGVIHSYYLRMTELFQLSILSTNHILSFALLLSTIVAYVYFTKNKGAIHRFMLLWIFSTVPLFFFSTGVVSTQVINTTIFFPLTLILGYIISALLDPNSRAMASTFTVSPIGPSKLNTILRYLSAPFHLLDVSKVSRIIGLAMLICITVSNISMYFRSNFVNNTVFVKTPILYKDITSVIDYTYQESEGQSFSICAFTNPLFIDTLWSYSYKTIGEPKYHYLPFWTGQPQSKNRTFLKTTKNPPKLRFLILEPQIGFKWFARPVTIYSENSISSLVEEKQFNYLRVQKRLLKDAPTAKATLDPKLEYVLSVDGRYRCSNTYQD